MNTSKSLDLKHNRQHITLYCRDDQVLVDMRTVCQALGVSWRDVEQKLLTTGEYWQVSDNDGALSDTLLMPAAALERWLLQPHGFRSAKETALGREALASVWAYEFPRQVMQLFPDSATARSVAAKAARAIRTHQSAPDDALQAGIKTVFLGIRQNRKPKPTPAAASTGRAGPIRRVCDITPELIHAVHQHYRSVGSFRGLQRHFNLTSQAMNIIISGRFRAPTTELLAAHKATFGRP